MISEKCPTQKAGAFRRHCAISQGTDEYSILVTLVCLSVAAASRWSGNSISAANPDSSSPGPWWQSDTNDPPSEARTTELSQGLRSQDRLRLNPSDDLRLEGRRGAVATDAASYRQGLHSPGDCVPSMIPPIPYSHPPTNSGRNGRRSFAISGSRSFMAAIVWRRMFQRQCQNQSRSTTAR